MATPRTTADLLSDVRARVAAPSANGLVSSADILALADQELRTELAAMLMTMKSEYWLADYTVAIATGNARYRLPPNAMGAGLRDVTVYDPEGREFNVAQIPADQRYMWTHGQTWAMTGPFVFTFENDEIVLLPTPEQSTQGWTLRMRYYRKPSVLDLTSNASTIRSADTFILVVDSASAPASFSNTAGSANVDIVSSRAMHEVIAEELEYSVWSAGSVILDTLITPAQVASITVSNGKPGQAQDYLCLSGKTVYPQIPESMWPLLVAVTCRAYCEVVGDMRGFQAASAMFERKKAAAVSMMTPRIDGEKRRPIPFFTPLRGGGRSRRGW